MLGLTKNGVKKMYKILLIFLGFFICACSLKPNLNLPNTNFTAKENNISLSKEWWKGFNDENLNTLIAQALKNNSDLRIAYVRLEQASAQLGISISDLLPKFDGVANATRAKTSKNAPNNQSKNFNFSNDFQMGLRLSYEIDLWGKYRDKYSASKAALKASEFDYEAARLSLISNVVQIYFQLANSYETMDILEQTLKDYTQSYELKLFQYENGAIGDYELEQALAELQSVKAQYTNSVLAKENYLKALQILVSGDLDSILYKEQDYQKFSNFALALPQGISSEILLQRPDINAALQRLTSQNYLVGVARTAFLPSLSLTGLLGFESRDLDDLVKNGSKTWNIGGNFLMPIFHWGEINQNVNLAKLYKDEAFLNYENTLKIAFGEIRLALAERKTSVQNYENYKNLLQAQEKIYALASTRYENGSIALIEYLDARRKLLDAKISFANANYAMANSIVNVIKAFGGGFDKNTLSKDTQNLDFSFRE